MTKYKNYYQPRKLVPNFCMDCAFKNTPTYKPPCKYCTVLHPKEGVH
jgi:hypothetical protein